MFSNSDLSQFTEYHAFTLEGESHADKTTEWEDRLRSPLPCKAQHIKPRLQSALALNKV